ncbi:DUF4153 domain-containing protein [candidate division KSB1 bacterium]
MIKIPSIKILVNKTSLTFRRFFFAILIAIIGTIAAFIVVDDGIENEELYIRIILSCIVGLPLLIASQIFIESKRLNFWNKGLTIIISFLLLIGYFITIKDINDPKKIIQFILYLGAIHLLVSFAPFVNRGLVNGFWQFNKTIFLHVLLTFLYTTVLTLGLFLAIGAIDILFSANIGEKVYLRLFIVIAGIFNTWFFLSGVPSDIKNLENIKDYPKGLKIFTQFVLLPLVGIYFLILYAYIVQILVTWNIPNGWVSYLVIGFSFAGILSLLLISPIKDNEENKWILVFDKWYYFIILPPVFLLFIAIGQRINQYGITENRYFILALAIWLAIVSAYFIFSNKKRIKFIPVSLCILTLLITFGPWGVFSISQNSQIKQLKMLLEKNNLIKENKIIPVSTNIDINDHERIVSVVKYLGNNHGYEKIEDWFVLDIDSIFTIDSLSSGYKKSKVILELMNLDPNPDEELLGIDGPNFEFRSKDYDVMHITGFDYLIKFSKTDFTDETEPFIIKDDTLLFRFNSDNNKISLLKNGVEFLLADLQPFVVGLKDYKKEYYIPTEKMQVNAENDECFFKTYFINIEGVFDSTSVTINNFDTKIFLKLK